MFSYNMRTSFHFDAGAVITAAKCRELGSCPLSKRNQKIKQKFRSRVFNLYFVPALLPHSFLANF